MPNLTYQNNQANQTNQTLDQTLAQPTVPLGALPVAAFTNRAVQHQRRQGNFALVMTNALHIYPLSCGLTTIGRDKTCRIQLADSVISRQHAQIFLKGDSLVVTDQGSTNGTFINGHRVTCATLLRGGDRLRLGSFEFVVSA